MAGSCRPCRRPAIWPCAGLPGLKTIRVAAQHVLALHGHDVVPVAAMSSVLASTRPPRWRARWSGVT